MKFKNILLIGGAGFIGTHLLRRLVAGNFNITVLDNLDPQIHAQIPSLDEGLFGRVNFKRISILDSSICELIDMADVIIHLASRTGTGQSMYQLSGYCESNIQGTANILNHIVNSKKRLEKFILLSSRSIYGEGAYRCANCSDQFGLIYPKNRRPEEMSRGLFNFSCPYCGEVMEAAPTPTNCPISSASIYAATKHSQEELVRIAMSSVEIPYVILRLQNVYGVGQSLNNPYTGILSAFVKKAILGMDLPIFEDGFESRDFINVTDVVNIIEYVLINECGDSIFNVGTGIPTNMIELANIIIEEASSNSKPVITGEFRVGDIRQNYADISDAFIPYDDLIKSDLRGGIRELIGWVRQSGEISDDLDIANSALKSKGLMH